jgi:hypothetical protein
MDKLISRISLFRVTTKLKRKLKYIENLRKGRSFMAGPGITKEIRKGITYDDKQRRDRGGIGCSGRGGLLRLRQRISDNVLWRRHINRQFSSRASRGADEISRTRYSLQEIP